MVIRASIMRKWLLLNWSPDYLQALFSLQPCGSQTYVLSLPTTDLGDCFM